MGRFTASKISSKSLTIGKLGEIMDKLDCSWEEIFGKPGLQRRRPLTPTVTKPRPRPKSAPAKVGKVS